MIFSSWESSPLSPKLSSNFHQGELWENLGGTCGAELQITKHLKQNRLMEAQQGKQMHLNDRHRRNDPPGSDCTDCQRSQSQHQDNDSSVTGRNELRGHPFNHNATPQQNAPQHLLDQLHLNQAGEASEDEMCPWKQAEGQMFLIICLINCKRICHMLAWQKTHWMNQIVWSMIV